jgi:two-component system LytT family response regulator
VDDEPLARDRLKDLLAAEPDIEVIGEAGSGSAAVEAISGRRPDLVLLDVQMPGLDGFGVLRCTAGAHVPAVVFVTAHDEHAIRAFEVQAVDYVLKPVVAARLRVAVRRAVTRLRSTPPEERARAIERLRAGVAGEGGAGDAERVPLKGGGGVTLVRAADIAWVQADGDYIRVHAGREVHAVRQSLTAFVARLKAKGFLRIHRSCIVNLRHVRTIEPVPKGGYRLLLHDGTRLRCGRAYRAAVRGLLR